MFPFWPLLSHPIWYFPSLSNYLFPCLTGLKRGSTHGLFLPPSPPLYLPFSLSSLCLPLPPQGATIAANLCLQPVPPHRCGILCVQGKGNVPLPALSTLQSVNRACHQPLGRPLWRTISVPSCDTLATTSWNKLRGVRAWDKAGVRIIWRSGVCMCFYGLVILSTRPVMARKRRYSCRWLALTLEIRVRVWVNKLLYSCETLVCATRLDWVEKYKMDFSGIRHTAHHYMLNAQWARHHVFYHSE